MRYSRPVPSPPIPADVAAARFRMCFAQTGVDVRAIVDRCPSCGGDCVAFKATAEVFDHADPVITTAYRLVFGRERPHHRSLTDAELRAAGCLCSVLYDPARDARPDHQATGPTREKDHA